MATGGSQESSAKVEGSDQECPKECDPCRFHETSSEVVAYCLVCTEHLCHTCLKHHRRNKICRQHEILEGEDLYRVKEYVSINTATADILLCDIHKDGLLKHYCRPHDDVLCDQCRFLDHCDCEDVINIEEMCLSENPEDETTTGEQVDSFLQETKTLVAQLKSLLEEKQAGQQAILKQSDDKTAVTKTLYKEIQQMLNQMVEQQQTMIKSFTEKELKTISKHLSSLEYAIKVLNKGTVDLEKAVASQATASGANHVLIAMKKIKVQKMTKLLQGIKREAPIPQTDDEGCQEHTLNLQKKVQMFGNLGFHDTPPTTQGSDTDICDPGSANSADVKDSKVSTVATYSVKEKSDTKTCSISSIGFLPSGEAVLCDTENMKVKVFGIDMVLRSSIEMPSKPWDIAVVGHRQVVVTLPGAKALQFVGVHVDGIVLGWHVEMGHECWGIAYHNNKLYVTCHQEQKQYVLPQKEFEDVLVLNIQGEIQQRISKSIPAPNGICKLCPYIAIDDGGKIYLTERISDNPYSSNTYSLSCYSADGQKEYTYSSETDLKEPGQMVVDDQQYVYVCGTGSDNVLVLTPTGEKYKALLQSRDGTYIPYPTAIAYRASDHMVLVGTKGNNAVIAVRFQRPENL